MKKKRKTVLRNFKTVFNRLDHNQNQIVGWFNVNKVGNVFPPPNLTHIPIWHTLYMCLHLLCWPLMPALFSPDTLWLPNKCKVRCMYQFHTLTVFSFILFHWNSINCKSLISAPTTPLITPYEQIYLYSVTI